MKEIKTDIIALVQANHYDARERERKANYENARRERIDRNKRKTVLSLIGGAIIGLPIMYFSMLFFLLL